VTDILIIANPVSGVHSAPRVAEEVRNALQKRGAAVELQLTTSRGDALRKARAAVERGVRVIAGCGGDGTLQEIATALDGASAALGVIPRGRCNDFARALGLKRSDPPERIADILLAGKRRAVDLGAAGEKRFLTVATMGFDSEASRFVETRKLWVKGTLAYLYAVACVLLRFKAPRVRLRGDFGQIEQRVLLVATGNGPCYGGAMRIAPGARLDDGMFQVCLVEEVSRLTVLSVLPLVMRGAHVNHPRVRMLETSFLEIKTLDGPEWMCADGESMCQTPVRLEVRPGALQVMTAPE
jgi:diacylglycerol kinase (ATP)